MEQVKELEELVVLAGLDGQGQPIAYFVCKRGYAWQGTTILETKPGIEHVEAYELSLAGKLIKTMLVIDTAEQVEDTSPIFGRSRRVKRMVRIEEINTPPAPLTFDTSVNYPSDQLPEWFQPLQPIIEDETVDQVDIVIGDGKVRYAINVVECWYHSCKRTTNLVDMTPSDWPTGRAAYACPEHQNAVYDELLADEEMKREEIKQREAEDQEF